MSIKINFPTWNCTFCPKTERLSHSSHRKLQSHGLFPWDNFHFEAFYFVGDLYQSNIGLNAHPAVTHWKEGGRLKIILNRACQSLLSYKSSVPLNKWINTGIMKVWNATWCQGVRIILLKYLYFWSTCLHRGRSNRAMQCNVGKQGILRWNCFWNLFKISFSLLLRPAWCHVTFTRFSLLLLCSLSDLCKKFISWMKND